MIYQSGPLAPGLRLIPGASWNTRLIFGFCNRWWCCRVFRPIFSNFWGNLRLKWLLTHPFLWKFRPKKCIKNIFKIAKISLWFYTEKWSFKGEEIVFISRALLQTDKPQNQSVSSQIYWKFFKEHEKIGLEARQDC